MPKLGIVDLAITGVEHGPTGPVIPDQTIPVEVLVRASGLGEAEVSVVQVDASSHPVRTMARSPSIRVEGGGTKRISLQLRVYQNGIIGSTFWTTVSLRQGTTDSPYEDANRSNNVFDVHLEAAAARSYDVRATLTKLYLLRTCPELDPDNRAWMGYFIASTADGRSGPYLLTQRHNWGFRNPEPGSDLMVGKTFDFNDVRPDAFLRLRADLQRFYPGLTSGGIRPTRHGSAQLVLSPQEWRSGRSFSVRSEGGHCENSFVAYFELTARP